MWRSVESALSAFTDNAMTSERSVEKLCEQRWIDGKKMARNNWLESD